jgi:hypothetical protein
LWLGVYPNVVLSLVHTSTLSIVSIVS